ncbi:MAG: potassium channel family protein [Bacteroidota bacterium]
MIENLILGIVTIEVCVTIQCVVLAIVLGVVYDLDRRQLIRPTILGASSLLGGIMVVMLAGNLLQMTIWAELFLYYGEFEDFATAFYHSVVNFTTLGYGDVVMSEERRLLGALEAGNGVLMFGLTTGFVYAVLHAVMRRGWDRQLVLDGASNGSPQGKSDEST